MSRLPLIPREHGVYGQMAVPLITSFGVAGVSTPALLLSLAVVAGFLAHEPLQVLLGRRGGRAKDELESRAVVWLAVMSAVAGVAGLAGAWSMPSDARWSLLLPLVPALFLGVAIVAERERGSVAEVAVALAFSLAAVPVCLAAGAPLDIGATVAAVFSVVFVTATLAVRGVVVATRGGGNPGAARMIRTGVLALTAGSAALLAVASLRELLPWAALIAAAPGLGAASWLALCPPRPTRLRRVGWTLVASSMAALLVLIARLG